MLWSHKSEKSSRPREGFPLLVADEVGSQLLPLSSSNVEGSSPVQVTNSHHLHPHPPLGEAVPLRPTQGVGVQAPHHVPTLLGPLILDKRQQQAPSHLRTLRLATTTKMMTTSSMCTLMAKNKLSPSQDPLRPTSRQRFPNILSTLKTYRRLSSNDSSLSSGSKSNSTSSSRP